MTQAYRSRAAFRFKLLYFFQTLILVRQSSTCSLIFFELVLFTLASVCFPVSSAVRSNAVMSLMLMATRQGNKAEAVGETVQAMQNEKSMNKEGSKRCLERKSK